MTAVAPAIARERLAGDARVVSSSRCHFGRAFDVEFAPWGDDDGTNDEILVTCGEDETARGHIVRTSGEGDATIERDVFVCRGHAAEVVRVGFARGAASERRRFATGSADGCCKIWNADDGSEARSLERSSGRGVRVLFSGRWWRGDDRDVFRDGGVGVGRRDGRETGDVRAASRERRRRDSQKMVAGVLVFHGSRFERRFGLRMLGWSGEDLWRRVRREIRRTHRRGARRPPEYDGGIDVFHQ